MSCPTSYDETHSDITAICPDCQDAVLAVPFAQRGVGYEAQVRGLCCTRCGFLIVLPFEWKWRWLYVAGR